MAENQSGESAKRTTIPVTAGVRDALAEDKPDDMSWPEFLTALHEGSQITVQRVVDIGELNDHLTESLTVDIPTGDMREAARVGAEDALEGLK